MSIKIIIRDLTIISFLSLLVFITNSMNSTKDSTVIQSRQKFIADLDLLSQVATSFKHSIPIKEERTKQYKKLRKAYKSVEFLVTYLDPRFVNSSINGAPLTKLPSIQGPNFETISPKGLQVIDELMFENNVQLQNLQHQATLFLENIHTLKEVCKKHPLQDRYIFESLRMSITRLTTMGITGFDTPSSKYSLTDAISILQTTSEYVGFYSQQDKSLVKSIQNRINIAVKYILKNEDFDSFDRYTFTKKHLNEINSSILKLQLTLNIETSNEVQNDIQPTNPLAQHVYSEDFLNPDYYTGQKTTSKLYKSRVKLGKLLFFDPVLSSNNERSCASCHHPQKGFTDQQQKSTSFDFKGTVSRNSPCLVNATYADRFFWDMRAQRLSDQIEHVVLSEKEFNTDFLSLIKRLQKSEEYTTLFQSSYPQLKTINAINKSTVSASLASYVSSLRGFNSKFDQNMRGSKNSLTSQEINGFNLFMGKAGCGTCHFAPTFSGLVPPYFTESESEVLGVTETFDTIQPTLDHDLGRYGSDITKEKAQFMKHSFKTVTIRNSELTAPYMHNGAFGTLDEVLAFYNKGGGNGLGLNMENQTLPNTPLHLSKSELTDIKLFMLTLTDTTNLTSVPQRLPSFGNDLDKRVIGGKY